MSYCEKFDKRAKDQYRMRHALKDASALEIGQDQRLQLMPFQVSNVVTFFNLSGIKKSGRWF